MGNTIRREPVNFSIPASPDYKFLNITNFRGLDVSSNPFELATNTASDCLNVYVDETNTLTTRPRLEKKELKDNSNNDILPLNGTCLGVYPLHDGYLFHYTQQMKILHGDNLIEVTVENPPQRECKCFEQGDKIYLLGEGRYMVIDENGILTDVDGYVPNRSIVRLDGTVEKDEPLNLLSDKFTEKYYWDGISVLNVHDKHTLSVENKYFNTAFCPDYYEPFAFYDDYSAICAKYNPSSLMYDGCYLLTFDPEQEQTLINLNYDMQVTELISLKPMKNTKGFWKLNGSGVTRAFVADEGLDFVSIRLDGFIENENPISNAVLESSPNGLYAVVRPYDYYTYDRIGFYLLNEKLEISKITMPTDSLENVLSIALSDTKFYCVIQENDESALTVYYSSLSDINTFTKLDKIIFMTKPVIQTTTDDSLLMIVSDTSPHMIVTFEVLNKDTKKTSIMNLSITNNKIDYPILTDEKLLFGYGKHNNQLAVYVCPDINKPNDYYFVEPPDNLLPKVAENTTFNFWNIPYARFFKQKYLGVVCLQGLGSPRYSNGFAYYNMNNEPSIVVTKTITALGESYIECVNKRREFLNGHLHARFDNNHWIASGNKYFRSLYNDPTYFPVTEYNELGDSNEDITGFNIANDTTLLAYKENRLYLIQPFHSETTGMTEYSITESKNTVGNTAIDAPIVTTLTEIPLQINNDGVYGLSQVSNVSAVERIADLMSEPINDRWLNEDDEVIKKAQTLNRLYWTYIILPYEKLTKVYLLDNRTNSWYYWELPIKLLNAFAKDNHAEFVDTDGNIYYLTTTDIRNMGFDTQLVTEYYDYGKKLIPWHWQSQVLYLGTMNHAKRLVNTTFILTDTDTQDGYGLQYSFKVFRKLASSVPEKELSGDLNLVRSTTKKTNISKFGFLQLKLSNITEDSQGTEAEKAYRNNKLRLVGLGLKYVLLEGLIR